jgi:short-subunit dehydrogenase
MTAAAKDDFARAYGPWAVIAGASEGVGAAAADQLAARGLAVVLLARNVELLGSVAAGIRDRHDVEVRTLAVDLTAPDAVERILAEVEVLEVGTLFYNAGAAGSSGLFTDQELAHARRMIALNCTTPTELLHALAPPMLERGRGALVLVGSTGAFSGMPYVASYSAAKAFQVNLCEGLWAEMHERGVHVLNALIGSTFTPARERRLGVHFDDSIDMTSEAVAEEILEHLADGPTRVVAKLTSGTGPVAGPWNEYRAFALAKSIESVAGFNARTNVPK